MDLRKYRNYYELLTEMPRFKHCTISFRRMRDIIPQIRKWFNQQSAKRYQELIFCQEDSGDLNLQNITILIVKAINDHEDDPAPSEIDAEEPDSTDEELIEEDGLLEEETETPVIVPLPWNYLEITPCGSITTLKPIGNQCVQSVKKATILLQGYLLWHVRTFTMKIVSSNG
ncbi:hypothetical protein RTP6_004901 [Batrachochytrium dendrobatidis]